MSSILIGDLLEHAEDLYGDAVSLVDGDERWTYREAGERARRLASGLLALGVQPGTHMAILADNSHRYWEACFAAHFAGTPLAPLNTRLSPSELEFIIRDGDIRTLLVGMNYLSTVEPFLETLPGLHRTIVLGPDPTDEFLASEGVLQQAEPLRDAAREWHEDDMAHLCYTGGTTGLPKGVMLTQRNIVANSEHLIMTLSLVEEDRWLHIAPLFHLADLWAIFGFTMVGARHIFVPGFTPEIFMETVQREGVTLTILIPTMINFVLNHPNVSQFDYSSMRLLLFGGAPMSIDRIQASQQIFGRILCQAYGMTEAAPLITCQRLEWLEGSDSSRLASCGREVVGVRARVVDDEGRDVQPGEIGEIIARGPNVMSGYWKRPEETEQAIRDGWLRTGDMARVDRSNFVFIVDRAKDMIITGGENVYSTEVEDVLYSHPAILEAAVIGIPHDDWGEAVHAVVVLRPESDTSDEALIDHCRLAIAGYKCPKSISFFSEPLPKSGPGKILKSKLREPFWEGHDTRVN